MPDLWNHELIQRVSLGPISLAEEIPARPSPCNLKFTQGVSLGTMSLAQESLPELVSRRSVMPGDAIQAENTPPPPKDAAMITRNNNKLTMLMSPSKKKKNNVDVRTGQQ